MSLPSGYTQLEYIESTGTQWIDTGVYPAETRILIDANILESNTGNDHHIASASWAETGKAELFNVMRLRADRTGYAVRYGNGNLRNIEHQGNVFGRHTFNRNFPASPYTAQVDSAEAITLTPGVVGAIVTTLPLFAFRRNQGTPSGLINMRLYSCKIWKRIVSSGVASTDLVREFIPCRNDNTTGLYVGAIGLWDDVNNLFYPNAGTGTFIAGELPTDTHKALVNGTVYEVKGGKCMVDGTVYSIKKGRTLINGTGYDITFEEAIGKTWTFDTSKAPTSMFPNLSAGSTQTFSVSFTSNGQQYIGFRFSHYYMGDNLGYVTSSGGITVYDMEEGWTSAYATITFDEAPSGDLLTWLQENAVQQ